MLAAASAMTGVDWLADLVSPLKGEALRAVKAALVLWVVFYAVRLAWRLIGAIFLGVDIARHGRNNDR